MSDQYAWSIRIVIPPETVLPTSVSASSNSAVSSNPSAKILTLVK